MICKTSLKANQLLDIGDIEGAQKMIKMYDALMKSGRFTAAQNKEETNDGIDAIGQIVALCEADGFIPRYYHDKPNDKVDRTIEDMQKYTHDLVTEELGLGNLIENAIKQLQEEKEAIAQSAELDENGIDEEKLFDYSIPLVTDKDFIDFEEEQEELSEEDLESLMKEMEELR